MFARYIEIFAFGKSDSITLGYSFLKKQSIIKIIDLYHKTTLDESTKQNGNL